MSLPRLPTTVRLLPALLLAACASAPPGAPPPESPPASRPQPAPLHLGVIGDQTGAADLDAAYAVLGEGVRVLAERHRRKPLHAVLHVGDLVESSRAPEEVTRRYRQATELLDRLPVDWYLAAGDHDVAPPRYRQDSPDRSRQELFERLYGPRIPDDGGGLYYGFDVEAGSTTYRVVVLYSEQALHADPRWGNVFLAGIRDDQLAWLERDLADHRSAAGVVVLLHQPLWYAWGSWQRVHDLLRRHPVALVLSGHFHYPQDDGTLDGIRYLTVGATGGDTKTGTRQAGDVQHVSVIEVTGTEVTEVELLPLGPGEPRGDLALTPRREMDRVQALDLVLGNLWNVAREQPVRRQDGALVSDCETGAPAVVTLGGLGNAIDRPVEVTIEAVPPITFEDPEFTDGMCSRIRGPSSCTMPPSTANVSVSNQSVVQVADEPPLWRARLTASGPPPDRVHLTVRLGFAPDSPRPLGPLALRRTVSIPVEPCP